MTSFGDLLRPKNTVGDLTLPQIPAFIQSLYRQPGVLGASTSAGGGGGGYAAPQAPQGLPITNPNQFVPSELDIIRSKLDAFRSQADAERGNAQKRFQDFSTSAGSRFDTLKQQLGNTVQSGLANLGQERLGTQNLYGRAQGQARSALESALTGNRTQARAQNRLNSSFYDDRQAGARQQFGNQIADTATEEARKLAGIGTRETETKQYGETEGLNLEREKTDLVNQAQQRMNEELQQADQLVRAGVVDSQEALNRVMQQHASRLDSIRSYIEQRDLQGQQLAAQYGQKIGSFQAVNPQLQSLLSDNSGLNAIQALSSQIPTLAGVGGGAGSSGIGFQGSTDVNRKRLEELGLLI